MYTPSPSIGPLWLTCLLYHLLNTRFSELIYKMIMTINNSVHVCVGVCMCAGIHACVEVRVRFLPQSLLHYFSFSSFPFWDRIFKWVCSLLIQRDPLAGQWAPGIFLLLYSGVKATAPGSYRDIWDLNSSLCSQGRPFISQVISQVPDSVYLFSVL